jgi:hypothetical protein
MSVPTDAFETFIELSVLLTGFERVDLYATGVAREYFEEVLRNAGEPAANELWLATRRLLAHQTSPAELETALRQEIFSSQKFGPVVQSVIQMWYTANWIALPKSWHVEYGGRMDDTSHVVSALAYPQGLVWQAIGAHPMGGKQQGFGAWSLPPEGGRHE